MPGPIQLEPRVYYILAEIFIAFGEGAGPIHVSHEAIAAATSVYQPLVENNVDRWHEISVETLAYAQMLGRATAQRAIADFRFVISAEDFTRASRKIRTHRGPRPRIEDCPFCAHAPTPPVRPLKPKR